MAKVAVIAPRYTVSGVPLAQWRIASALAKRGDQVDLIIGRQDNGLNVPTAPGVNIVVLNASKTRKMFIPLVRYLRHSKPDYVFSAEDHLNAIALSAAIVTRSGAKISGSSHVTPFDTYSSTPLTKRWFLKHLMRMVSWRADALTCVSEDMVLQYRQTFGRSRHVCVYNVVDTPALRLQMTEPVEDPWVSDRQVPLIVGAGSLVPWKGFEELIAAFSLLRDRGRDARLMILGEGPDRAKLEAQIEALDLSDRVRLPGQTANPMKYFAQADVFALSSRVEGMPTVLVEAMLCGTTVVATDCPTGPRELLQGGRYGYLVPPRDPAGLADGIEAAIDRPIAPELIADAVQPFSDKAVLTRHFALLDAA